MTFTAHSSCSGAKNRCNNFSRIKTGLILFVIIYEKKKLGRLKVSCTVHTTQ